MAGFDPFSLDSIVSTQRRARTGSSPLDDYLGASTSFSTNNLELDRLLANLQRQQQTQVLNEQYAQEQARNQQAEAEAQALQAREINGPESESFFDYILNSLNKPLEAVKNLGQGLGQAVTGDFGEALKSAGRAIGSATPYSETALGILGLQDDVGALLDDGTGVSTGESGNVAFGSGLRARDGAALIGELLGEAKTNTDANGSIFSEFGESGLQDFLTTLFTGVEIVGDPTNFLFGAGAANKAIKAGKTVEASLDALATVNALKKTGLASIAEKTGVALSRVPESLIGGLGGEDAAKLFRGAKAEELAALKQSPDLVADFLKNADELGGKDNPLFEALETASSQFGKSADELLPGATFAEQYAKGQRQLLNGPYSFLNDLIPDSAQSKTFNALTNANKLFGAGSAIFSDSTITGRLKRLGKLRESELEDIARKGMTDGNTDLPAWRQSLRAGLDAFRRGFLQDADSAAAAEILTKAPSLRREIGFASETVFNEKLAAIETAIKAVPEDKVADLHARVIRQVEENFLKADAGNLDELTRARSAVQDEIDNLASLKAGPDEPVWKFERKKRKTLDDLTKQAKELDGEIAKSAPLDSFDQVVYDIAANVTEAEEMLKSFQRGNGVWIRDLESQLNYFSRSAWSDEFQQWLQRNPKIADNLKDAQATAARTAKESNFKTAESALRRKIDELAPDALPKDLPLFEDDVVKNLHKQINDAGDRIFRARIQDELIRTNRMGFDEQAATSLAAGIRESLEQVVGDALVSVDEIGAAKNAELLNKINASKTKIDELESRLRDGSLFGNDDIAGEIAKERSELSKLQAKYEGQPKPKKGASAGKELSPEDEAQVEALGKLADEFRRATELVGKTPKPKLADDAAKKAGGLKDPLRAAEKSTQKAETALVEAVEKYIRNNGFENFDEAFDAIPQEAKALWVRKQLKEAGYGPRFSEQSGLDIFLDDGGLRAALPRDIESLVSLGMSNVPKAITKDYKRVLNLRDNAGTVLKGVDQVNKVFRGFLLSAPQSVATDVVGNAMTAMTLGGLNPADIGRGVGAYARHAGEESLLVKGAQSLAKSGKPQTTKTIYGAVTEADVFNELQKRGLFNQINIATQREKQVSTALDDFLSAGKPKSALKEGAKKVAKPAEFIGNEAFTAREFQDNGFRMAAAMKTLKEGGTWEDAVAKAREIFFDYGDATNFEKSTLRRAFMFYAFTKKSMAMLGKTAFEKPIANKMLRLMAGAGVNQGDEDFPDWAKKTLGLHLGTDEAGNPIVVGVNGNIVNSAADKLEGNAVHNLLMSLSPVAKVPLELGLDRDLFTGKPIGFSDENVSKRVRGGAADRAPAWMRYLPDFAKKAFDFRENVDEEGKTRSYEMDPRWRWIFEAAIPLGQWSRVVEKGTFADERKTVSQDLLSFTGTNVRSIAGGSKADGDLRHVRDARLKLEGNVNSLAGRPLKISRSGLLEFNEKTDAGLRLENAIAPKVEAAQRELAASGMSQREIDETLYQIELREISRLFPQMGAIREVYARLWDAERYLEGPEEAEKAHEERLAMLQERIQKRQLRELTSFLPR
jgi:cell fate (sporulation/competence/biofilm development) regulator YmcA (YheA/YmcA/DUF963 family)